MAETKRTLRIFISSPGDVRPERLIAERVIQRLDREFAYHFNVRPVLWEREPLVASAQFQETITPPRETDVVVVVLWSRLGVPLPADKFMGPLSGNTVTGTEWEFEDALKSCRDTRLPDLLVYRKLADISASLSDDDALEERRRQKRLVEKFFSNWFVDQDTKSFTAAFREFANSAEFEEQLETHLRELLRKRLEPTGDATTPTGINWHEGSPFRGLLPFELKHAPVFFGRTRARTELRELLHQRAESGSAFVLVLGASGSGKSSLVKAGLLADVSLPGMIGRVALVRHAIMRPSEEGGNVLRALAAAIVQPTALPELLEPPLSDSIDTLASLLTDAPGQVARPIKQGLALAGQRVGLTQAGEARLMIIIDQLEELFTVESIGDGVLSAFVAALEALAKSGVVWIVATLRSDFFDRLDKLPQLVRLASDAQYVLAPPEPAEIGQIIRQPTFEAGVRFEIDQAKAESLDEVIREATTRDRRSLPLLSFLLDQLWQRRDSGGRLTFAAYHELGGLEGALARRAEQVFGELPAQLQAAFPALLRSLVTMGQSPDAVATSRSMPLAALRVDSPERLLVDALVAPAARLLVADRDAAGVQVRIAHEALLTHWPRARDQIATDRHDLQLRARLEQATTRWQHTEPANKRSLLLQDGLPLSEAEDVLARRLEALPGAVVEFIKESANTVRSERRRQIRRLQLVALVLLILTATAAAFGWHAWEQSIVAQQRERVALRNESLFLAKGALDLAVSGDAERASLIIEAALPENLVRPNRPVSPEAFAALARVTWDRRLVGVLVGHEGSIGSVFFNSSGDRIVTVSDDKTARIWNAKTGAQLALLVGHEDWVSSAAFDPSGERVVTGSYDNSARIWNVAAGTAMTVLRGHSDRILAVSFSPNGDRVATASADGTARLWDAKDGTQMANLQSQGGAVRAIAFSPAGDRLVTASSDGSMKLWDAATGADLASLSGHTEIVASVAFDRPGARIVSASYDRTARIWDAKTGTMQSVLEGHDDALVSAVFSPGGDRILTASFDRTARIWSVPTGREIAVLRGHTEWLRNASFDPSGNRILTTSYDLSARLWDARDGSILTVLGGHNGPVRAAAFDPSGDRAATVSSDGLARIWDTRVNGPVIALAGHRDGVNFAVFAPRGEQIATASSDRSIGIWDAASGKIITTLRGHGDWVKSVDFDSLGHRLVSASADNTARIWDLTSGTTVASFAHPAAVLRARFDLSGRRIVTGCTDGQVRIWNVETGALEKQFPGHENAVEDAAFSRAGDRVLTASSDGTARIWDVSSGRQLAIFAGHQGPVYSAQFDRSEALVVTASRDRTARVWRTESGAMLSILSGHGGTVRAAIFNPSGRRIATAARDGAARVWDTETGTELAVLAGHSSSVLSVAFDQAGERIVTASEDVTARVRNVALLAASEADLLDHLKASKLRWLGDQERKRFFIGSVVNSRRQNVDPKDIEKEIQLAAGYDSGPTQQNDPDKAMRHHAMASRLCLASGNLKCAEFERARTGTIARALGFAAAVKTWRALSPQD